MTVWMWIGTGVAGVLALSLVLGIAMARILGKIGEEVNELLEAEPWTSAPLSRETETLVAPRKIGSIAETHERRSHSSHT
jgi:hypothetical protein